MMKKFCILVAVVMLILSVQICVLAATDNEPKVELNGTALNTSAYVSDGNLYLPLRAVSQALGYKVEWSSKEHVINLIKAGQTIKIDPNTYQVTSGDHMYYMSGDYLGDSLLESMAIKKATYLGTDFFSNELGLKIEWDKEKNKVILQSIKPNDIAIKNIKETSSSEYLDVTLQYPRICGLSDQTVQDSINSVFEKAAQAAKEEGIKNAEDLKNYIDSECTDPRVKAETYFDYRIKYNQNGLLSVVLLNYQYAGGAHGLTIQSSYNFDLKTGKNYQLSNLMKDGVDYITPISKEIRAQIDERVKAGLLVELGEPFFTTIAKDQPYYLTNDALVFYFQEYEYFPYAAGIQEFPIKYSSIEDLLKPEFSFLYEDNDLLQASGAENKFAVGDTFQVTLKGNATTGYTWNYTVSDSSMLELVSESSVPDSDLIGAGSTYTWKFKVLKPGETTLTFKYYRTWESEGSADPDNTVIYKIIAK